MIVQKAVMLSTLGLLLSGCATLVAPDEVAGLQSATDDLAGALKAADQEQSSAASEYESEQYRLAVARGTPVKLWAGCDEAISDVNFGFEGTLPKKDAALAIVYDSVAADSAFRRLRNVKPCGIEMNTPELPVLATGDLVEFPRGTMGAIGQGSLPKAARQLDAYVAALADIATGESSGKVDAAQSKLIESGKGLLGALKIGGPADAILNFAGQAIGALVAAKRNKATREFLDKMDEAIPLMMERLGAGGRIAVLQAALNRARATSDLSDFGNDVLNRTGMVRMVGGKRVATDERMATFDDIAARLSRHNTAFLGLRKTDPMVAARDFAEAHHSLREVFHDPRANRAMIAASLAKFQESAAELAAALKPAS